MFTTEFISNSSRSAGPDNQNMQTYKEQKGEDSLPLYKWLVHTIQHTLLAYLIVSYAMHGCHQQ